MRKFQVHSLTLVPFDFNWHVNYLRGLLEGKRYLRKTKKVVIIYEDANSTGSFFTLLPSVCWLMNLPNLNCVTIQRLLIWWLCLVSMWQRFKPNIFSVFSHLKPFSLFSQQHDFSFSTGIMEDAKSQVYLLSLEWCHWCFTLKKERKQGVKILCL